MADQVRIDKWLWAVRIFKTRSIATDACNKGRVLINDVRVKPSKTVAVGDQISVVKPPVTFRFKVLAPAVNRVGAKEVPNLMENITPKEQYDILEMSRMATFSKRDAGAGRPTKKDRRDIDSFMEDVFFFDE